jgi:hypothetical protein
MADTALLQTIISGILSGGASAGTAFAAVFRDIKKRLTKLEEGLGEDGADGDPKTGLYLVVERLDETTRKLKKEMGAWEDDPPEWLLRLINKAARNSSVSLENQAELERMIEQRARLTASNIRAVEEKVDALERRLNTNFLPTADYERDARQRSEEVASIREQLATANGLLRGVLAAMGYTDPTNTLTETKKRPGG